MKSGGLQGSLGKSDIVICLSDDENGENNGCEKLPPFLRLEANSSFTSHSDVTPSSTLADHSIAAAAAPSTSSWGDAVHKSVRSTPSPTGLGVARRINITSPTSTRGGGPSPGITRAASPESAMVVTILGDAGAGAATDVEKEGPRQASQRNNQARKRNTFIQTLLSTPGCVLLIDNLEIDAQPIDLLGQLMKFSANRERIHSVHIPPAYPELNHAVGYVVFMNKESADDAAALLTRNFVVSARGRPWIVTRCVQKLNEEDFGFPTISAFQGDTQDGNGDSFGGLKILTDKHEAEYDAAKRRRVLFEQHRRQAQFMFQRHSQEEKALQDNPDLNLYR